MSTPIHHDALKSEIRLALINKKANACPIALRLAWHAAGTYDQRDGSGGCQGATMRFAPEATDPSNAGLSIARDLLQPVKERHPEISYADLYAVAGCVAIEFLGGPAIPFRYGRSDDMDGARCPMNGRLPDASQGADHLRGLFGARMGFDDKDIVALSGAHTLGRCHAVRSGFDGPWSTHPLRFDNDYYVNLLKRTWVPRKWEGNLQYMDEETEKLMMLPTDLVLIQDAGFRKYVELFAADEQAFFHSFARAFARLISLGCPAQCDPFAAIDQLPSDAEVNAASFRELAMHGSVGPARELVGKCDVHATEANSGRTALHKAAFWGHNDMVAFLVHELNLSVHAVDHSGDTPLHDAAHFGHDRVVEILLGAGASPNARNAAGRTPIDIAVAQHKEEVARRLRASKSSL